jgi:trehalose 6-phosphate phosphatase
MTNQERNLKIHGMDAVILDTGSKTIINATDHIRQWHDRGLKTAVIISGKNSEHLKNSDMISVFDKKIYSDFSGKSESGNKSSSNILIKATGELGVSPDLTVFVGDAEADVQAGKEGEFAFSIGINKNHNKTLLYEAGADVVIDNLHELELYEEKGTKPYFTQSLPSVFSIKPKFFEMIWHKKIVIFLDYDGTLTPIVKQPEDAVLSDRMRETLEELTKFYTVAIVSGRDMKDVMHFVKLDQIIYAGSHGFRISGPDDMYMENEKAKKMLGKLDEIEKELRNKLENKIKGVKIERKHYAIAVHYRNSPEDQIDKIVNIAEQMISKHTGFKKGEGKKVVEVRPDLNWHKGKALYWILDAVGLSKDPNICPMYIGDDITDEDAFKAIADNGIGILVGTHKQPTAAQYKLENVDQVQEFLQSMSKSYRTEKH